MLAMVVPAIAIPIERGALGGLFPADLGAAVAFTTVGAFLVLRGNGVIAAIMCTQGLGASATVLCGVVRDDAATRGPLHGAPLWAAWVDNLVWLPGVTLLVPLLLLLPNGRLGWRHSRWPVVVTGLLAAFFVVAAVGRRGGLVDGRPAAFAPNPTAFFTGISDRVLDAAGSLCFFGFVLMIAVSLGALVARRRRATGVERAQLASLLYGGALTVVLVAANQVLDAVVGSTWWTFVLGLVAIAPIPCAIAVAVRRYRLYEIDRVVSRTVTYAVVLAVQVNGKLRTTIEVAVSAARETVEALALAEPNVQKFLEGLTVRKVILVPGKIVNIVAG